MDITCHPDPHHDRIAETAHLWRTLERVRDETAKPRDRLRLALWVDTHHRSELPPSTQIELDELIDDLIVELAWRGEGGAAEVEIEALIDQGI